MKINKIKEKTKKFFLPHSNSKHCLSKLYYQLDLNQTIESAFFLSFFAVAIISIFVLNENIRNYPIAGIIVFQMIILFSLYTHKLVRITTKTKEEWFKTKDFEKVAIHYFITRKDHWGHIIQFIIFVGLAFIASYSLDVAINYDKEVNENIIEGFLDLFNKVVTEDTEFAEKVIDFMFVLPWLPIVFLLSSALFRFQIFIERDLYYYFAYVIIRMIAECKEADDFAKFNLFKVCLELYNKYLRSTIRLSLDNTDMIYSKIIGNPSKTQDEIYSQLLTKFEGEDTYKPLRFFGELVGEETSVVKKQKPSEKIRTVFSIIFPIIMIIIAIIREVRIF